MVNKIELVEVDRLRHIEGFSQLRAEKLAAKIQADGVWNKPLALDDRHGLVMDGQHRMEAAGILNLRRVPAVLYPYADVEIWSLRPGKYQFDWQEVERRALSDDIYPYKTVKHKFPIDLPSCGYTLDELR